MKSRTIRIISAVLSLILLMGIFTGCGQKKKSEPSQVHHKASETVAEETKEQRHATVTRAETEAEASKPDEKVGENQTDTPVITGVVNTAPDQICISGTCAPNAVVTISGGIDTVSYNPDGRYFLGTVYIPKSGSTTLKVTAKVDGKESSPAVEVNGTYKASATHIRTDIYEVVVGKDYQGFFVSQIPDFECTNLLTPTQITKVQKNIGDNVKWLNDTLGGAELIYLFVPDPMNVYPELVPDIYVQDRDKTGTSRLTQFCEIAEEAGAKVINLLELFKEHKHDRYKLFNKTDSHWTEYGAFLGYTELFNYISQKFPAAAPRTIDEMGFSKKDIGGGDMPYYLELDTSLVREITVESNFTFSSPANEEYYAAPDSLIMNQGTTPQAHEYHTGNSNLPDIYIMRDSFSIHMFNMLPERCNNTYYKAMWSYSFVKSDIESKKPDYVLYILTEHNIPELLY